MTPPSSDGLRRPVVLGVDAHDTGRMTAAWAADEADRRGLPLQLVHAVPSLFREFRAFDEGRYHKALRERGDQALDRAAAVARERHPDLAVTTAIAEDVPAPVLCRESAHAALVVLGSRRLGRTAEALSAYSVTVPVSAQAHCPVVVVRDPEHITQDPPYVVVGVDGSPSSEPAVDFACDFADERHAAVRVLWVWQRPPVGNPDDAATEQVLRRLLFESTTGRHEFHPDVAMSHELVHGHPVEELGRASEHALAVIVGRRGRGGFTGMRLGSVPHGLLHRAHCPVVIVPSSPR
ncbi:universal stress protein [Streptomyces kaniharaensis]|uniref:Universal stress protein n=1 Tax=Streptomyces kaniharaensis TaxID=212423 RepID=A0A6N7L596_9ACTN|nr:universal stress protein [Streptomyces kaniharaensis]MQS17133.1 universal stress protein [Streptomyces kaniharaensis]